MFVKLLVFAGVLAIATAGPYLTDVDAVDASLAVNHGVVVDAASKVIANSAISYSTLGHSVVGYHAPPGLHYKSGIVAGSTVYQNNAIRYTVAPSVHHSVNLNHAVPTTVH